MRVFEKYFTGNIFTFVSKLLSFPLLLAGESTFTSRLCRKPKVSFYQLNKSTSDFLSFTRYSKIFDQGLKKTRFLKFSHSARLRDHLSQGGEINLYLHSPCCMGLQSSSHEMGGTHFNSSSDCGCGSPIILS